MLPSGIGGHRRGCGRRLVHRRQGNYRIKVSNGTIATVAGNGNAGYNGDNIPATSASLSAVNSVAVDSNGNLYISDGLFDNQIRQVANGVITTVAGNGDDAGFGGVADAGNGRIRLLTAGPSLSISNAGVVSAASPATHLQAAPGGLASAYGTFLVNSFSMAAAGLLPLALNGAALRLNNAFEAPLLLVGPSQINFQVPWELAGQSQLTVSVLVQGQASESQTVDVAPIARGVFSTNGAGSGQGAILDSSYQLVDASNPAIAGSRVIQIYCTGLGPVTNQPPTSSPASATVFSETAVMPSRSVARWRKRSFHAPGLVGVYQVNALAPALSAKGAAVPVVLLHGPSEVTNGVLTSSFSSNVTTAVR